MMRPGASCTASSFNPRSPWEERPQFIESCSTPNCFNPRSPWEERRTQAEPSTADAGEFQSTLPVGGATTGPTDRAIAASRFNPRSPWEERRGRERSAGIDACVSIHAPRGRSDSRTCQVSANHQTFQSTLPVGGATWRCGIGPRHPRSTSVSIHAPRGRSDCVLIP